MSVFALPDEVILNRIYMSFITTDISKQRPFKQRKGRGAKQFSATISSNIQGPTGDVPELALETDCRRQSLRAAGHSSQARRKGFFAQRPGSLEQFTFTYHSDNRH